MMIMSDCDENNAWVWWPVLNSGHSWNMRGDEKQLLDDTCRIVNCWNMLFSELLETRLFIQRSCLYDGARGKFLRSGIRRSI